MIIHNFSVGTSGKLLFFSRSARQKCHSRSFTPMIRVALAFGQAGPKQNPTGVSDALYREEVRMSEAKTPARQIRSEVHGRVFKIIIHNALKKNAFSPDRMAHVSERLTT